MAEARDLGVNLELDPLDDEGFWLSIIERTTGKPGAGADVLTLVKDYADECGMTIHATIVHDHERLSDYYQEQGFSVYPEKGRWRIEYSG